MPRDPRESAVKCWAFTFFLEYPAVRPTWVSQKTDGALKTQVKAMKRFLRGVAESWTFQLERSPTTGSLHFQGRVTLTKRMRRSQVQTKLVDCLSKAAHWSHEVAGGEEASLAYCTDPTKRSPGEYSGPWSSDPAIEPYIPPQFRGTPNGFQSEVLSRLDAQGTRKILCVVDARGNIGKSWLSGYLGARGEGLTIPSSKSDSNALLEYVHSFVAKNPRKQWTLMLDVPRSMVDRNWAAWLAAVESIKNGVVHDTRYQGRVAYFHWPKIVIFTNAKPPTACLSADRWDFWEPTDAPQLSGAAPPPAEEDSQSTAPVPPVPFSSTGSQWTDSQLEQYEDQAEIEGWGEFLSDYGDAPDVEVDW